jgi:hypothetical protein
MIQNAHSQEPWEIQFKTMTSCFEAIQMLDIKSPRAISFSYSKQSEPAHHPVDENLDNRV